jgi:hypothetical protein
LRVFHLSIVKDTKLISSYFKKKIVTVGRIFPFFGDVVDLLRSRVFPRCTEAEGALGVIVGAHTMAVLGDGEANW